MRNIFNRPRPAAGDFGPGAEYCARYLDMAVFPVAYMGKTPLTTHGFKDASKDLVVIANWTRQHPNANIGCATGAPSGIVVLDFDQKPDAKLALQEFERRYSPLPHTVRARSGSGGIHLYFRSKIKLPCRTHIIQGVDFRADGGYIIIPYSVHENGRRYEWEPGHHINEVPIADIPDWLIQVVIGSNDAQENLPKRLFRGISGPVTEGCRNDTLTSVIGHLLGKRVDPYLTKELVLAFNQTNFIIPLPEDEVLRVLESIAGRELKKRQQR